VNPQTLKSELVVFFAGFGIAFILMFGFGMAGALPILPLALILAVSALLLLIPKASPLAVRLPLSAVYAVPFLLFWLLSEPASSSVLVMTLSPLCLAAILWLFSAYQKQASARATVRALMAMFVLAWMVAYFSASTGAGGHMVEWLRAHTSLSQGALENLVYAIRKSIHFLFYGTLAMAAFRGARVAGARLDAQITFALSIALIHASFDELRQAGFASRAGSFYDVLLDMAGAGVFVLILARLARHKDRVSAMP